MARHRGHGIHLLGGQAVPDSITVPWDTLAISVVLYVVVPVSVSQVWRRTLLARGGAAALERVLAALHPLSLLSLLATLVLLFGFQGDAIINQPFVIAMLAVPILMALISSPPLRCLQRGNRANHGKRQYAAGACPELPPAAFFAL